MIDSPHEAPIERYQVIEYLSEGGMGAIYLGKKLGAGGFERPVVLKQLLEEFTSQPEFIDLFIREARLSGKLDHANIVKTIDMVTAGENWFIVMEYVHGADLRTLLKRSKRRHRRFSPGAGIFVAQEVLAALSYAHNYHDDDQPLRLIHRDVSPSNILISHNGEVKLTDFGIAKAATHNSVFYRVKGKVGYMSPEQARSETLDSRSDLYSLAVCLYESITGERLFISVGLTMSAEEIYSQPVPRLSEKISGLPRELDDVMFKALALDPDDRYQTAAEFKEALVRCAHRHGLQLHAAELSAHLREVCGHPDNWRDTSDEPPQGAAGTVALGRGEGTELYENFDNYDEGTEQIDPDELDGLDGHGGGPEFDFDDDDAPRSDLISVVFDGSMVNESERRQQRALTSMTNLGELQTLELTSMINIAAEDHAGAEPLVDLDAFGSPLAEPPGRLEPDSPSMSLSALEFGPTTPGYKPDQPLALDGDPYAPYDDVPYEGGSPYDDSIEIRIPGPYDQTAESAQPKRPSRAVWIFLLILLLGVAAAIAVGMSGPEVEGGDDNRPAPGQLDP